MPDALPDSYARRLNKDGSFDSICPKCFATVATERDAASLDDHDRNHVCQDSVWARMMLAP
jgi:hypothetical protein